MNFAFLLVILALLYWLTCIANVLTRKDIDDHLRVLWLLVMLVAPVIGAVFYSVFGPKEGGKKEVQLPEVPDDADAINPDHMSWNPITGYNRMEKGTGLNPPETENNAIESPQNQNGPGR